MPKTNKPLIKKTSERKFLGLQITSSLVDDKTYNLWSGFMPRRKEIENAIGSDLFSMQVYPSNF